MTKRYFIFGLVMLFIVSTFGVSCIGYGNDGISIRQWITNNGQPENNEGIIDLSFQNINSLDGLDLIADRESVHGLFLKHNKLTSISQKDLEQFHNLKKLSLDGNRITELKPGVFCNLKGLDHLSLEKNKLTSIPDNVVSGMKNLVGLYLSKNKISFISSDALKGLENLKSLSLSNNLLSDINAPTFSDLISLENIFLSKNKISAVDCDAFRNSDNLLWLDITSNQLAGTKNQFIQKHFPAKKDRLAIYFSPQKKKLDT